MVKYEQISALNNDCFEYSLKEIIDVDYFASLRLNLLLKLRPNEN